MDPDVLEESLAVSLRSWVGDQIRLLFSHASHFRQEVRQIAGQHEHSLSQLHTSKTSPFITGMEKNVLLCPQSIGPLYGVVQVALDSVSLYSTYMLIRAKFQCDARLEYEPESWSKKTPNRQVRPRIHNVASILSFQTLAKVRDPAVVLFSRVPT